MDRKIVELLRAGQGTNKIARTLRVSKKRVVEVRKRAGRRGYLSPDAVLPTYPEVLFPEVVDQRSERSSPTDEILLSHKAWIEERLEVFGWDPITVWEELPVRVPRSNFYRFLKRHKLPESKQRNWVIPEILTAPGESLQLDWAKLRTVEEEGQRKTLWMLIGVLGFSRYMMVRLVWRADVETTLEAIRSMFEEIGGVPWKITTDNPKCLSILASKYEPLLNPVAERFASYYGCLIECLPPYEPQKKGKVERQVKYLRRLYQAHGNDWWGLEESQNYLNKRVEIANNRKHGTTGLQPTAVFEQQERAALKPLPVEPYEIEEYHSGRVRCDGCVRFRGKYYSVGMQYAQKQVVVIGNSSLVSIYHDGKLLEVHDRNTNPHQSKSIKPHHRDYWERTFEESSIYRKQARKIGEWTEELIITILAEGNGFVDFRKIWGILSLDKTFRRDIIEQACMMAHEQERWSYWAVREYAEKLTAITNSESESPRQLSIKSAKFTHDISRYSEQVQLSLIKGGKNESRDSEIAASDTQHGHRRKGT